MVKQAPFTTPTMNKHKDTERGFHWSSKAWYAKAAECENRISVGMYAKEGGTTGELQVRWYEQGRNMVPSIEIFDDAWPLFSEFADLFKMLSNADESMTEQHFVDMLLAHGFKDMTAYKSPY